MAELEETGVEESVTFFGNGKNTLLSLCLSVVLTKPFYCMLQ
jgi:hypothetical protein